MNFLLSYLWCQRQKTQQDAARGECGGDERRNEEEGGEVDIQ
jgi:hypothetical protein